MSIESLDQFVDNCAACRYITHRCYKYKDLAYCDLTHEKIDDLLGTCKHFQRNPDLPPVDNYYTSIHDRHKKKDTGEEETKCFFFDYNL